MTVRLRTTSGVGFSTVRARRALLNASCLIATLAYGAPASAGAELRIEHVQIRHRGTPVATFATDGECGVLDMRTREWQSFSSGDQRPVTVPFPASRSVTPAMERWRDETPLSVWVYVKTDEQTGIRPAMDFRISLAPGEGAPMFLAEFISLTCWIQTDEHLDALAKVKTLPRRARRWVVDLVSVAARLRHRPPDDLFALGHYFPWERIPRYAKRCGSGRDCGVWAWQLYRGFFDAREP